MQRTPTALQPRLAAHEAAGHTTSVWQVRGVLLWLVALSEAAIRHHSSPPLSLFCCAVHGCVCGVSRVSRAPRKIRIWMFGNMVKWSRCPILDLMAWVRASQFMSIYFFSTFFFNFVLYYVRNPDTTDDRQHTSSAGCVLQPGSYNAIHTCRLPAEQEATPHACGSLSALYYCGFLYNSCFCYRTLRSVGLRVSAAVWCMPAFCHRYYNTDIS